ncbi:hypothetical protein BLNAU_10641 [Blattamonas nauphoetae]|uniref:Uncharacterized protein n=1 Tax=Blattamonas nauphoetae TaxID=2049346 RepID=A0ABQ9XQ03_9EUKA|nr:hypothetical protein BLNAU_10641 [Blattamonas nauphoetae]
MAGSTVHFLSSTITSNGLLSPFQIRTSENTKLSFGSRVIHSDVTHLSNSDHLLPLVGLMRSPTSLTSSPSADWSDLPTTQIETATIIGTGISLESKHLVTGTGPLFSFGLSKHSSSLAASDGSIHMETSLLGSTLVNVSSPSALSPNAQLFGSEISQRVVGSCVSFCTNHDSGTGMMSPNLGGNVVCLNTSFASCVRERNKVLEFSFEDRTNTSTPARLNNVSSDVTSVSFTLCTFNAMTYTSQGDAGGAAVFLSQTSSSLTLAACFFHKCTCTGNGNKGGAVFFESSASSQKPFSVSASSFTECSTLYSSTSMNCGGSLYLNNPLSVTIDKCFFDTSKAEMDGAGYLWTLNVSISNSAFVKCSSSRRGGAISLRQAQTLSLSFVQFRTCSSVGHPDGRDIYVFYTEYPFTADMVTLCDTTSAQPNVYFIGNGTADSTLVPQVKSTPTITSVDVTFDGDKATVTVETDQAIKGTLGVLLDESNVPRLVHVKFGEPWEVSRIGTAVVSCGTNGILPIDTTYTERKWTLIPVAPPIVDSATPSLLEDWNTTKIALSGANLEKGSYWMLVEKDGKKWNISLTRSDSETLTGTPPLHPSTAPGRLEWSTEYEVTQVMWVYPDGQTEEEVRLTKPITFTTPIEPARIVGVSCVLDESKNTTSFKLRGRQIPSGTYKVTLNEANGPFFDITFSNPFSEERDSEVKSLTIYGNSPILQFGTTYTLFTVGSLLIDTRNHTFSISAPSRLTSVKNVGFADERKTTVSIELVGVEMPTTPLKLFVVKEGDTKDKNVSLDATFSTKETGTAIGVGYSENEEDRTIVFGLKHTVVGLKDGDTDILIVSGLEIEMPAEPARVLLISCTDGVNETKMTVDGVGLSEHTIYTLSLSGRPTLSGRNTDTHVTSIEVTGTTSTKAESDELVLYPLTDADLRFGFTYEITGASANSKPVMVESTPSFSTPTEPARIEGVAWKLNGLNNVLIVELSGRLLSSAGQTVVLSGSSREVSSNGVIFDVTSTNCFVNFSIGSSEDNTHVVFGGRYKLLSVGSGSSSFVVNADLFIDVPHPPTITSITCPSAVSTPSFVLTVSGSDLPSDKTFTVALNSGHTFEISFSSETSGTSGDIAIGGVEEVQYGTGYTIQSIIRKVSGKEDELILFPSTPFTTPLGPTLSLISCDFDLSNPNFVKVTLTTMNMPSEAFTLTLTTTETPIEIIELSVSAASISSGLIVVEVYNKTQTLKYGRSYSVSGMRSSSVIAVVSAPPFSTPDAPIRVTDASCSLGAEKQTSALVTLTGVNLGGNKDFNVTVQTMVGSTPSGSDILLKGTFSGASSLTSHTLSVLIFGAASPQLSFGATYVITEFDVDESVPQLVKTKYLSFFVNFVNEEDSDDINL